MAINFTKPVLDRLNQEIAEMEAGMTELQKKTRKTKLKINQLEKDCKLSSSPSSLSSKMSRITKLQAELKKISQQQLELSKEINKRKRCAPSCLLRSNPRLLLRLLPMQAAAFILRDLAGHASRLTNKLHIRTSKSH